MTVTVEGFTFPETAEEAREWRPSVRVGALHTNVLCAAKTRIEGTWAAYCAPVPGIRHELEAREVLSHGAKLREDVARVLFPVFAELPYAR